MKDYNKYILSHDENVDIGGIKEQYIFDSSIFYVGILYFNILFQEMKKHNFGIEEKLFINKVIKKLFVYIENNQYKIKSFKDLMTFFEYLIFNFEYILYRLTSSTGKFHEIDDFVSKIVDTHIFSFVATNKKDDGEGNNVILLNEMLNTCNNAMFPNIKTINMDGIISGLEFISVYRYYHFIYLHELQMVYNTLRSEICEFMKIDLDAKE